MDNVVVKVHKQRVLNGVSQACEGMKVRSARITARADRQGWGLYTKRQKSYGKAPLRKFIASGKTIAKGFATRNAEIQVGRCRLAQTFV